MIKLLIRLTIGVVLLLLIAGVVGYLWLDTIAKTGIEKGGSYALGVPTRLDDVSLSPFSGKLRLEGLNVANPEGFSSPHAMHSGTFDLEIVPGSLLEDTIQVRKFELDGLDLHIERKGSGSNLSKIIENLERLQGEQKPDEPDKPDEGKKIKVDRLTIRNVVANFHLPVIKPLKVEVPTIEITDLTSDDADGIVMRELIAKILPAILVAVLEKGRGIVPDDFLHDINGQLSGLTALVGGNADAMVKNLQGRLGEALGGELGKRAGKTAEGAAKTVGGVLEGLLGGKKEPEKETP